LAAAKSGCGDSFAGPAVSGTLPGMSGLIAIVGRPNVGKSALFNRIAGKRIAIVHDMPGVTRDRVTAEVEWHGRPYTLVDTGGIGLMRREKAEDVITQAAFDQVQIAIESADAIILVVNVQEGIVPLDAEVAKRLRAAGRPVLLAANKADNSTGETSALEFSELGFGRVFPVSAIHGRGLEALMNSAMGYLPKPEPAPEPVERTAAEQYDDEEAAAADKKERKPEPPLGSPKRPVKLAIVGRPNVGKSSIINALTGSERVIVSPIPGTTRDAVDVPFEVDTEGVRQNYVLIDTAGLRKARRVEDTVEFFSTERTRDAINRCDITVLVLDAENGVVEQDKKISDLIVEAKRACIVVVNKWDLVTDNVLAARQKEIERREKGIKIDKRNHQMTTLTEFGEWVQEKLFFLDYAPVIFTSAKDGFQLDRLLESVRYVAAQLGQEVPTSILNRTLQDAVERRQPVSSEGHRLKLYYATQVRKAPPTFLLFVNRDEILSPVYNKYMAAEMRRAFGYEGCPIILVPKPRPKTIEPLRKFNQPAGLTLKKHAGYRPKRFEKPVYGKKLARPSRPGTTMGKQADNLPARTPRPARPPRPDRPGTRVGAKSGAKPGAKRGAKAANASSPKAGKGAKRGGRR
jgi:GTP-binding protein